MSTNEVTIKDLHKLFYTFEYNSYETGSCEVDTLEYEIIKKCEHLLRQDYTLIELDNTNGALCPRYPSKIFIPEYQRSRPGYSEVNNCQNQNSDQGQQYYEDVNNITDHNIQAYVSFANPLESKQQQQKQQQQQRPVQNPQKNLQQHLHLQLIQESAAAATPIITCAKSCKGDTTTNTTTTIIEENFDISKLRDLITKAKYARCRQRFVVPVIMYRGKYICRSATISVSPETYCRKVVDCAYEYLTGTSNATSDEQNNGEDSFLSHITNDTQQQQQQQQQQFSYEEAIKNDILLLQCLNVATVVDLMVENRKIKYFMAVSSSEKADPENRYNEFHLLSLPYPGCEFFKSFRDNNYLTEHLYYDWSSSINDAALTIPPGGLANKLDIKWSMYKDWDLVLMTQNYLKACLKYISEDTCGLLIHCISGWDRTPLFVSLVRLSLWADNLIHQSLSALEIAYLTVAYDWYLFGHQLPDRLRRHEDIMFFCFDVLNHLRDEQFSIVDPRKRTKTTSNGSTDSDIEQPDNINNEEMLRDRDFESDQFYWEPFERSYNTNSNDSTSDVNTYSPTSKRSKTNPIWVPMIGSARRKRNESSSSSSSWQNVDYTGSVDGSVKNNNLMQSDSPPTKNNLLERSPESNEKTNSASSSNASDRSNTINNEHNFTHNDNSSLPSIPSAPYILRFQRLSEVRTILHMAYSQTIGLKPIDGT